MFASCGGNKSDETTDDTTTETITDETNDDNNNDEPKPVHEDPNTFNAKFVGFEFHDAPHFFFEDESGKKWDFGSVMVTDYTFETESEDGFVPNPELIGKTFKIKYITKDQPLYTDGPIGEVKVVVAASLVE